nr:SdpI family protein [Oscillospiraceae bacterium]
MSELLSLLKEFDIAKLLPDMSTFVGQLAAWMRLCLLLGPLVIAGLGAVYYFIPPKEANHALGYRSKWSMSSVEVWQYAQRIAGMIYMVLGGGLFVVMLVMALIIGIMQPVSMAVTVFICVLIQVLLIIGAHFVVEKLLRKHFDINGNKKAG